MTTLRRHVLEYGVFPFAQFLMRERFWSSAKEFRKLQWLPQEELEHRQMKKLRKIVAHAYENVPFYRKRFKEAGFTPNDLRRREDIAKIPILTKEQIRRNFPQIIATNINRNRRKIDSTSGSSGEPLVFYRDTTTDDLKVASDLLVNSWCGIEPGDRILWISHPRQIGVRNLTDNITRMLWNKTTDLHWIAVSQIQEENADAVVKFMDKIKPRCLYGYTSGLLMLARCLNGRDSRSNSYVRAIVSSAETLSPFHKKLIQETFDCGIFNRYGMRELGGSVAQDCERHEGLHVNTELYLAEVTRDGQSVASGEKGQVLVTDLSNMVMPFIRYQTGDIAVYGELPCSCGRGFPIIETIVGRETESVNIRTPSGRIITHPGYFLVLGDFVKHIRQFQFFQERLDELTVKVVPYETFNSEVAERLTNFLSNSFGTEIKVALEIVDEIPPERSGKRPIVKSKIQVQFSKGSHSKT